MPVKRPERDREIEMIQQVVFSAGLLPLAISRPL
jgi:hypothetical protein